MEWSTCLVFLDIQITLMIILEGFLVMPIINLTKNHSRRIIYVIGMTKRTRRLENIYEIHKRGGGIFFVEGEFFQNVHISSSIYQQRSPASSLF